MKSEYKLLITIAMYFIGVMMGYSLIPEECLK